MLTGDKLETAENIGYSCKLIQSDFKKMFIKETDDLEQKYKEHLQTLHKLIDAGIPKTLLIEGKAICK